MSNAARRPLSAVQVNVLRALASRSDGSHPRLVCLRAGTKADVRLWRTFADRGLVTWDTQGHVLVTDAGRAVALASGPLPSPTVRARLDQTETWDPQTHGAYAKDRCCRCGRKLVGWHALLCVTRTDGGEWYVVDPESPAFPDEGIDLVNRGTVRDRTLLPIGPECLRACPELAIGIHLRPELWVYPLADTLAAEPRRE
jgi:hypothetical protein